MADEDPPKPLLKKNGKFVKQGGRLVRTDDPAKCCKCCDTECCEECFAQPILPRIIATRLFATATEATIEWDNEYPAPQPCDAKYEFKFSLRSLTGAIIAVIIRPSTVGITTHRYSQPIADACAQPTQIASIDVVLSDPNGVCPERNPMVSEGPDYKDICIKPPCLGDGDCQFFYLYSVWCGALGPFETAPQAAAAGANRPECFWTDPTPVNGFCCDNKCYPYRITCGLNGRFDASQRCKDHLNGDPTADVSECCPHFGLGMTASSVFNEPDKVECGTPLPVCSEDNKTPVLPPNFPPAGYQVSGCAPMRSNPLP